MKKSLYKIAAIQFLIYAANGLFTPAWYVLLLKRGQNIEQFGLLLGLTALGSVAAASFVGILSHYRHPLRILSAASLLLGAVMALYVLPSSLQMVYLLQVLYGTLGTAILTLEQILISTYAGQDGKSIGFYNSIMHGTIGVAMIAGGYAASMVGGSAAIMVAAGIALCSSVIALLASGAREQNITASEALQTGV